ncbi:MAG: SAM-dependent methyltransferase [Verrucomicrobiota bacterium]|nr:SAM-dependent methyltransferase [Verrucomicrobiota bacterium]
MNQLQAEIAQEITRAGPMNMARFMELALYHPALGYYRSPNLIIGKSGDFYTSVSVGSCFGELLARRFICWATALQHGSFQIVELAAHNGQLASDILHFLRTTAPSFYEQVTYTICEPRENYRIVQRQTLAEFSRKVEWHTIETLPQIRGVIFSNELFDALPARLFRYFKQERLFREIGVGLSSEGKLDFVTLSKTCAVRPPFDREVPDQLPDGFFFEISETGNALYENLSQKLKYGYLLTIDYGFLQEEIQQMGKLTLRAYHNHHLTSDILANPGEQDITRTINFTELLQIGERDGLKTEFFTSQERFLMDTLTLSQSINLLLPEGPSLIGQLKTLTNPQHLGSKFRVLLQSRF